MENLREQFSRLNIWSRGSQRAPHKPLLVLYALGRLQQGAPRLVPYSIVDRDLRELLEEFGPSRKSYHPEYPFWRLQNDGLWEVNGGDQLMVREGHLDAKKSELLRYDSLGGFTEQVFAALSRSPNLARTIALDLLDGHFAQSLHDDITSAVGLSLHDRVKRDPHFRADVLDAYEHRCAICGYDVHIGHRTLGLEAAHIKWHTAGGPDTITNGLALCSLHHKAFDLGAYTLTAKYFVQVSEKARGGTSFDEWLMRYHGLPIRDPVRVDYLPHEQYINWHHREVFKEPGRPISPSS